MQLRPDLFWFDTKLQVDVYEITAHVSFRHKVKWSGPWRKLSPIVIIQSYSTEVLCYLKTQFVLIEIIDLKRQ